MKKIIYLSLITLVIFSCKKEVKDYATLSGSIQNKNSDSLLIISRTYKKIIPVNEDGSFKDTLKIKDGYYSLFDGKEAASLYLKNNYDLNLTLNTNKFDESINYSGRGSEANNYLAKYTLLQGELLTDSELYQLEKKAFSTKVESAVNEISNVLLTTKNIDSTFIDNQQKTLDSLKNYLLTSYEEKRYLVTVLGKGKASPKFVDYENYVGGSTSLDDLKGKYVYIDMWATWCGPCIMEIPYLQKIEKAYHNKNISFVSISVDRQTNYNKWRKMVAEKELTGIQLYAKEDITFVNAYKIKGIPRFILIDPQGNIVNSNAPRPSSKELIKLFTDLKI